MTNNGSTGPGLGAKLFVGFLVVATAALSLLVVQLTRQNKMLRATLEKLDTAAKSGGLIPGDLVDTIQLIGPGGKPYVLDFGEDKPFTLFLLTSAGCGACEETIPVWEGVLTEVRPKGLRIVNVCAGVSDPGQVEGETSPMWTTYAAPQGREGWIRRIPLAPSALLIGASGSVVQRWYGALSDAQAAQMRTALIDVAGD
jgi:hypothetical protein